MARRCAWCHLPNRRELERRVVKGESLRLVALDSGHSESAAQRHFRNHVGRDGIRTIPGGGSGIQPADFAERLAHLAEETAAVRAHAKEQGDGRLLLSAIQAERDTITTLINRLGIDSDQALELVQSTTAFAKAANRVFRTHPSGPEIAEEVGRLLDEQGEDETAQALFALVQQCREAKEVASSPSCGATSGPPPAPVVPIRKDGSQ